MMGFEVLPACGGPAESRPAKTAKVLNMSGLAFLFPVLQSYLQQFRFECFFLFLSVYLCLVTKSLVKS